MSRTNYRCFGGEKSIAFYRILGLAISILLLSDLSCADSNFRCSHVPPVPDEVSHVWLPESNFSIPTDPASESDNRSINIRATTRKRREHSIVDFQTNRLLNAPSSRSSNNLLPIKISVHYDSSIYLLEREKYELITSIVMPSVVKFFENALAIRHDYVIDTYRIARRCPNNTIYYARDLLGLARPFCMDRCEDYAVCGEIIVPKAHLAACSYCNSTSRRCLTDYKSEGIGVPDAQLLLYVSAKQTPRCRKDQTIAYAAHCAQDAKTDRPVAGHANLCPSSISTDLKDLKALIATVKHELTHVLGFSVSLFAYYRDEFGQPLTRRDSSPGPIPVDISTGYAGWSEKVIKKFVRRDWLTGGGIIDKEVHLVVTPTVVKEVRSYFNCSTLEGAELEDQGADGTSMTHWEKRLFENEAMTGTHTQNSIYSRLTLAVLQDTGWYIANFSHADKLEWGRNLGCAFVKKSCKSWINERRQSNQSIRPFCDKVKGDLLEISCTEDRTSKAVCNMKQYNTPLPARYQNFDFLDGIANESLAHYGGSVDLADYCPFIQEFTWQAHNVTVRGSRCDFSGNNLDQEKNAALEHYGPKTRCFEHGQRWDQRSCIYRRHWHHYGAGCYTYECTNGHLSIVVGNHSYPCYYPDQLVHIQQMVDLWYYTGSIICPACAKLCPHTKCKTYDKQMVDKILSLQQVVSPGANISDKTTLDLVIDSINFIEPVDLDNHSTLVKLSHMNDEINVTSEGTPHLNEVVQQIISSLGVQPRHSLICSGSSTFALPVCLWILVTIWNILLYTVQLVT